MCCSPAAVANITAVSMGTDRCWEKLDSVVSAPESTSTPGSRAFPRQACGDTRTKRLQKKHHGPRRNECEELQESETGKCLLLCPTWTRNTLAFFSM